MGNPRKKKVDITKLTWFTPEQCGEILQMHAKTVIRHCVEKKIYAIKPGSQWRIPKSSIDKLASQG